MANKDRNKRSARKARAEERARVEAAQAASVTPEERASQEKKAAKEAKAAAKAEKNKDKKPGVFRRLANYLGDVRSEMRRVVWPSKDELKTYSVAIIIMLVIFGMVIWLVDSGIVAALVGFTGLRG